MYGVKKLHTKNQTVFCRICDSWGLFPEDTSWIETCSNTVKVKVKHSRNGPGVAQRVPGVGSQISMTFCTWRWWGRQPHATASFTSRKCSWYSFSPGVSRPQGHDTVRRNMSLKNPVTTQGIDPGAVQLVALCLNHYVTPGPITTQCYKINI